MTHLFFSKAYDDLIEMERIWVESHEKYGYPALYFYLEETVRGVAEAATVFNGVEELDTARDLMRDPHPYYPYTVEESVLTDAGFAVLYDEGWKHGTLCRVPLEEPVVDSALRVLSLCRKFNEPVDVSHYKQAYSMSQSINFNPKDERLVNCIGFSSEWLAGNVSRLRSESTTHKRAEDGEDPSDNQYSVDVVPIEASLLYGRGENVLPKGLASMLFGCVISTSIDTDDLSSTAKFRLLSGDVVEGYARQLPPDALGADIKMRCATIAASEAYVFRTERPGDIELSIKQSGPCEVSITGKLSNAKPFLNPWTGVPFWALNVLYYKDDKHVINSENYHLMEQNITVFTSSLHVIGAVIPRNNDMCTVTGVLCIGEYSSFLNE
jgi:hypothetical protein